jgi:hypothetical protein
MDIHWESLEFKYYSTVTAVTRLNAAVTASAVELEECLAAARKCLEFVNYCQKISPSRGDFTEEYSPYLSW